MNPERTIPELVAPAGSFEVLEAVLAHGADAVYLGPRAFSLRAGAEAFSDEALARASGMVHQAGRKLYLTMNSVLMEKDLPVAREFVKTLPHDLADGVIVTDPALIAPLADRGIPIHLSTQTSTMNAEAAKFWKRQGVKRIVLARELSLPEIGALCREVDLEFEVFAHGALCMSISGRCLFSDYLVHRSANQGECAQPCRWRFQIAGKGEVYEAEEEDGATLLFNSKDLNTISILGALLNTGVAAIKIEGRNKGLHYAAVVVQTYKAAIAAWRRQGRDYQPLPEWQEALEGVSHRGYTTGFYQELHYGEGRQYYADKLEQSMQLLGVVREALADGRLVVEVRNRFDRNTRVSCFSPNQGDYLRDLGIRGLFAVDGSPLTVAAMNRIVILDLGAAVSTGSLIRTPLAKS